MANLFQFTPAELYLLKAAPYADYKHAIMLTMKDLSLKDVIDITIETVPSRDGRQKQRQQVFVHGFTHFNSYKYRAHEYVFRDTLKLGNAKLPLAHWLKYIDRRIVTETSYGKMVRQGDINDCFKWFNWQLSTLSPKRNKKGNLLRRSLELELRNYVNELKQDLVNKPNEAWDIIKQLNGFLYLMPSGDLDDIVDILSHQNSKLLQSNISEPIYRWFLELEKLKEFDNYFNTVR